MGYRVWGETYRSSQNYPYKKRVIDADIKRRYEEFWNIKEKKQGFFESKERIFHCPYCRKRITEAFCCSYCESDSYFEWIMKDGGKCGSCDKKQYIYVCHHCEHGIHLQRNFLNPDPDMPAVPIMLLSTSRKSLGTEKPKEIQVLEKKVEELEEIKHNLLFELQKKEKEIKKIKNDLLMELQKREEEIGRLKTNLNVEKNRFAVKQSAYEERIKRCEEKLQSYEAEDPLVHDVRKTIATIQKLKALAADHNDEDTQSVINNSIDQLMNNIARGIKQRTS